MAGWSQLIPRRTVVLAAALLASACTTGRGTMATGTSTAGVAPDSTATPIVPSTAAEPPPEPTDDGWRWLVPTTPPLQLTLAAATVDLRVDCPENADCIGPATLRTASLDYRTPGTAASVVVRQVEVGTTAVDPPLGVEATIAGRRVMVVESPVTGTGYVSFELGWNERPDLVVRIEAFGLSRAELDAFVSVLLPATQRELEDLVATAPPPEEPCVRPAQFLAPTVIPDSWERFVLSAQSLDACTPEPVLAVSLVKPGDKIVTIVTRLDTGGKILSGQQAQLGRRTVLIERGQQPAIDATGPRPTTRVSFNEAELVVEVSATNVSDDELATIIDGIAPVDAPAWTAIVAATVKPPSTDS